MFSFTKRSKDELFFHTFKCLAIIKSTYLLELSGSGQHIAQIQFDAIKKSKLQELSRHYSEAANQNLKLKLNSEDD